MSQPGWSARILIPLVLFCAISGTATAESARSRVPVPLIVKVGAQENRSSVDVGVFPEPPVQLETKTLIEALAPWVDPEVLNRLDGGAEAIPLRELPTAGLGARFDERTLELTVEIPLSAAKTQPLNIVERTPQIDPARLLNPADFSGFINFFGNQGVEMQTASPAKRSPFLADSDFALNYRGWVAEGGMGYNEGNTTSLFRRDYRLVHDIPEQMLRFTAGDLNYPVTGFQQFRPIGGLSATRNFNLQPYRITVPTGAREIILRAPSQVNIYINRRLVQSLRLPAGRYDLRDFPILTGSNDIRLEITDDLGRKEEIRTSAFTDAQLLSPGLHQFTYDVGFPSRPQGWGYDYDTGRLTGTFFHRVGVSEHWTLGVNGQADRQQGIGGLENTVATPIGSFSMDFSNSQIWSGRNGSAARTRYFYQDYGGPGESQRGLGLSVEYRQFTFAPLGELNPEQLQAYNVGAQYNQEVVFGIAAQIGGDYGFTRKTAAFPRDSQRITLNLTKQWIAGLNTNLLFHFSHDASGTRDRGVFFLLSWALPGNLHTINASEDSSRDAQRLDWRYHGRERVDRWDTNVGIERVPRAQNLNAQADYQGNRANVGWNHLSTIGSLPGSTSRHQSAFKLASALVFADGAFAFSRPVTDGFILVKRPDTWRDQTINLNPDGSGSYDAQVNNWGRAPSRNARAYHYYSILADGSQLDTGFELGQENFTALPSYKRGFLVPVGIAGTISAVGVIKSADGRPVPLLAGKLEGPGSPDFFTNREGRFQIDGLKPGRYRLRLADESGSSTEFEIPSGARSPYNLGIVPVGAGKRQ